MEELALFSVRVFSAPGPTRDPEYELNLPVALTMWSIGFMWYLKADLVTCRENSDTCGLSI